MKRFTGTVAKTAATVIAAGLLLTGCSVAPNALDNYSGPAVVKNHDRVGKLCYVNVKAENGVEAKIKVGNKGVCTSIAMGMRNDLKDGATITLKDGDYKR